MEYNEKTLTKLIEDVSIFNEINISDIPSIDLYMDQITTFFDDRLGHLKRNEEDAILTKTMINNYTKGRILMAPNKKKYSKQHIILLILIYNLKQSLSIHDIHSLFSSFVKEKDKVNSQFIEDIYSIFLDIKEEESALFKDHVRDRLDQIKEKAESIEDEDKGLIEMLIMVLMLINQANLQKRLAEKILDEFFEKKEEKEKKSSK